MPKHLTPKDKREALAEFETLAYDLKRTDAATIVGEKYNVCSASVLNWSKKAGGKSKVEPVVRHVPQIEAFTSEDFEVRISQPTARVEPAANGLVDSHGRYDLNQAERWLILPDTQIPYHDSKAIDAVLKYASENYYHGCLQLGDFMDWDFCSRWTSENVRKAEGQRFLQEYIHGNAVLDDIQAAVRTQNPNCHLIVLEGNHDFRIQNVIDKTPALAGMIDMEQNLRFAERRALYWRYWVHRKPIIIGKAHFIHGDYIGTHHAKKTADSYHRNVFYGHTHTLQAYTKTTLAEDSVQCWSLGTLSVFDLEYMGKRPSSWMQCFAEFFFEPDGSFNHYVTNIIDHAFTAINGKRYVG